MTDFEKMGQEKPLGAEPTLEELQALMKKK